MKPYSRVWLQTNKNSVRASTMRASSNEARIRDATVSDVSAIILTHQRSFQSYFLTFLGPGFLRELYAATLADSSGIAFVAEEAQSICGFVTGTAQPSGFYRRLLRRRWWRFAWAAALPALKHPSAVPRLLRAFSMPQQATQQAARGTLMSLAVLPEVQGKGIGRSLVMAFLTDASRRGLHQVDLTTDKRDNEGVNRFYQDLGFVCARTFMTAENRVMNEYVIDLPGNVVR